MSELGKYVKEWRLDHALTQATLTDRCDCSPSLIQSLECGRRRVVQREDLMDLAWGMKVSFNDLMELTPDPNFPGRWIPIN